MSNSQAKYEALIAGLCIASYMRVTRVICKSES